MLLLELVEVAFLVIDQAFEDLLGHGEKFRRWRQLMAFTGKIADVACGDNQFWNTLQRFVQGALPRGPGHAGSNRSHASVD